MTYKDTWLGAAYLYMSMNDKISTQVPKYHIFIKTVDPPSIIFKSEPSSLYVSIKTSLIFIAHSSLYFLNMRWYVVMPHIGTIHYLVIAVVILAVCNAVEDNFPERIDDTMKSINSESTMEYLINVDLYYAAMCRDSWIFVGDQLLPVYENLGTYMNITYIPYGKGTHEKLTNENGTEQWNFTCQHGPAGCYGNKAQACAINEILTNPEISDEQQVLVNFVGCVMTDSNPAVAVPRCLEKIGIDANYIASVEDCIASTEGDELLAAHGDKTHALQPEIAWVPTIVINEVFSQEDTDTAEENFQDLICEYIPAESQPAICNRSTSSHSKTSILTIAIFALVFCLGKGTNDLF